jgi:biopolymer transport protein ExbD
MPFNRSIQARRVRKRIGGGSGYVELPLTSMMDVLVIIVVFLLKSYATSNNNFATVSKMQMPYSASPDNPPDSLQVIITPEGLTFESNRIMEFVQTAGDAGSSEAKYNYKKTDLDEGGRRIIPLFDALTKAREKSEVLRAKSKARDKNGQPLPFDGILAIQADKRVQYDTIRKIMYTAGTAGYRVFRFLAMKRDT